MSKVIRFPETAGAVARVRTRGQAFQLGGDIYFGLLTRPLWQFALIVAGAIVVLNAIFAGLYVLDPDPRGGICNARPGSYEDAFFFSVQTLATIGYGTWAPQTRYAHVVVTFEAILGTLVLGAVAGVAFARLSRPRARVIFTDKLVICKRNGVPHLHLRAANWRTNLITEATLRVYLLIAERTEEGETMRTPIDVPLVRPSSPFFFLTWTALHKIDEKSPFYGDDAIEKLKARGAQLFASLSGYDQVLGQMVHAYREFKLDDIVKGARFADVITLGADGRTRELDFARFHDVEPLT
jgi:inward rectifier potassium channel